MASRLERSCGPTASDWIRVAPATCGFERAEAFFSGHGFDPHRHDTYAVGFTIAGVQAFRYRGAAQYSTADDVFVLHPDELHDGRAGTDAGFRYRIAYLAPALIADALGEGHALPFIRDAVSKRSDLKAAFVDALSDLDAPLDELQRDQAILGIAEALAAAGSARPQRPASAYWRAVRRARDMLDGSIRRGITSAALEQETSLTRFALARHFRACLGTSPYRYLIMRRLDHARSMLRSGHALAETAAACGFADQSHMTRHFRKTYGLSPGRWTAIRK